MSKMSNNPTQNQCIHKDRTPDDKRYIVEEKTGCPFTGSGTTLISAKQLGHKFIGTELSPKYCEIANQRLRQEILI